MLVDAYASLPHYAGHLRPVWEALPDRMRGTFWGRHGTPLHRRDINRTVLVAGFADARRMEPSRLILLEHGAGQSYDGDPRAVGHGSYSGGEGLDRVVLFLCPNGQVARRWVDRYPATPAVAVGCPYLDRWHVSRETPAEAVAVTFHWECTLIPETRSAWRYYDRILPDLAQRWPLLGHGHPRLWGAIRRRWEQLGVEPVADLADVFDRASLLVGDNSSALYEFASLARPVVVLNAPWYRRDIHHGLRFWDLPPGLQCDRPDQVVPTVARALADPPAAQRVRELATSAVYAATDGSASERAARAIMEVVDA